MLCLLASCGQSTPPSQPTNYPADLVRPGPKLPLVPEDADVYDLGDDDLDAHKQYNILNERFKALVAALNAQQE